MVSLEPVHYAPVTHVHAFTIVCVRACVCICECVRACVCACVCVCVLMHISVCVCMYVCMCIGWKQEPQDIAYVADLLL